MVDGTSHFLRRVIVSTGYAGYTSANSQQLFRMLTSLPRNPIFSDRIPLVGRAFGKNVLEAEKPPPSDVFL